jgi:hypothetical protein
VPFLVVLRFDLNDVQFKICFKLNSFVERLDVDYLVDGNILY